MLTLHIIGFANKHGARTLSNKAKNTEFAKIIIFDEKENANISRIVRPNTLLVYNSDWV